MPLLKKDFHSCIDYYCAGHCTVSKGSLSITQHCSKRKTHISISASKDILILISPESYVQGRVLTSQSTAYAVSERGLCT